MKNGKCPKCNSTDIRTRCGDQGTFDMTIPRKVPVGKMSYALVQDYVCISCGYLESFIACRESLQAIVEKWDAVMPVTQQVDLDRPPPHGGPDL